MNNNAVKPGQGKASHLGGFLVGVAADADQALKAARADLNGLAHHDGLEALAAPLAFPLAMALAAPRCGSLQGGVSFSSDQGSSERQRTTG